HGIVVASRRVDSGRGGRGDVLDRIALAGRDQPVGYPESIEEPALAREVGPRLRVTSVKPRRREEHRVREGARPSEGGRGTLQPCLEEAFEGRLHRAAPGGGADCPREG